jgi:hypothetical protein
VPFGWSCAPASISPWIKGVRTEGLATLLKIFDSHADALRGYGEKHEVFIWCGIFSSSFDGGPRLSPGMLKALGNFGVSLWLDTYSSKNQ